MSNKSIPFFIIVLMIVIIQSENMKAQEVQVPICDKVQVITPSMAAGVEFFSEYPGFKQATVYQTSDSTMVMEILYEKEGSILRARRSLTEFEIAQVCLQLNKKTIIDSDVEPDVDRDGRRKVIAASMAYSLLYYAWAIPTAFSTESGQAYTGSYLLIGSAGYFIPMITTQKGTITNGMSKGYTYGCFLGIGHGLSLGALLTGEFDNNAILGISVLTSIGEGIGGLYYARQKGFDRAQMRTMGSLGTWGLAYGLGIPAMAESEEPLAYAGSSIAVSALGIIAGDHFARKFKPSDGDVTVINGMGVLGAAIPLTVINSIVGENGAPAAYIGGAIAGSLAGISMGFKKTSKINYTRSDGNLIILGEVAGGLIGGGISALVSAGPDIAPWIVCAGLVGGFLVSDHMIIKRKRENNLMGMNLSFDFNPVAFRNVFNDKSYQPQPGRPVLNIDMAKVTLHL